MSSWQQQKQKKMSDITNIADDLFGTSSRQRKNKSEKRKGSAGERLAASVMTEWTGWTFERVPQSWGLNHQHQEHVSGDIYTRQGDFAFSVEVKTYKDLQLKKLTQASAPIWKSWKQAARDAQKAGKIPMLLCRQDKMPAREFIMFIESKYLHTLNVQKLSTVDYIATNARGEVIVGLLFSRIMKNLYYPDWAPRLGVITK